MILKQTFAFLLGVVLAYGIGTYMFNPNTHIHVDGTGTHPIGSSYGDEVHVHSDFVLYLAGKKIDLTGDRYMTSSERLLHNHIHLHDNNDDVIHRHAENISLSEFMSSLGYDLSDECVVTDAGESFCSDNVNELILFVNGESYSPITEYVNQEEDKLLLYYGDAANEETTSLFDLITDDSCYYSGTCPERGVAPSESCGLTCEL